MSDEQPQSRDADSFRLCDVVRQTGFEAHVYLRHGHLEKVYENALANRLRKLDIHVEQQAPIPVFDEDGAALGNYIADLIVDGRLVVELKACRALCDEHIAQMLAYLRASRLERRLLLNYGAKRFEARKLVLSQE